MERFRKSSLPVLLPVLFVLLAVLWFGIQFVTRPARQDVGALVIGSVVYAGLMTAFFGIGIARTRRRAGGADEVSRIRRAVKTGVVPPGVDPATWTPELERARRQYRRNRWFGPVVFVLATALGVWLAVTDGPVWWVFVALFVGFLAVSLVDTQRSLRRLTPMLEDLRQRPQRAADGPAPTPGATWTLPDAPS
jgi:TctA family transporter